VSLLQRFGKEGSYNADARRRRRLSRATAYLAHVTGTSIDDRLVA